MAVAAAMAGAAIRAPLGSRLHHPHRGRCRDAHQTVRNEIRARMRASSSPLSCAPRAIHDPSTVRKDEEDEGKEESFSVLTSLTSQHNDIVVVDTPKTRFLLLDSTHNIHSMLNKEQKWTGSYWDEFASLPAVVPPGPIAILGLGGGTAAHLMLELWPSLQIEGWEIDEILIDMAREYFGLSDLEKCTEAGGSLSVHIGDALSPSAMVQGGFAGIIVDLFSDGKILPELHEDATWIELGKKLMAGGRIMVNCGGAHSEISNSGDRTVNTNVSSNGSWVQNSTIKALCRAFPRKTYMLHFKDILQSAQSVAICGQGLIFGIQFSIRHRSKLKLFCCFGFILAILTKDS